MGPRILLFPLTGDRHTPIAKHTRNPEDKRLRETCDRDKQMGGGRKRMAGPLGKENGNLWSTEGINKSWCKGVPRQTTLLPWKSRAARACGASIYLVLRLGWAERPSCPEENNRPVFLSSSCDPEAPHKEEEGGKGSVVPRHSLGEGPSTSQKLSSGLKATLKNAVICVETVTAIQMQLYIPSISSATIQVTNPKTRGRAQGLEDEGQMMLLQQFQAPQGQRPYSIVAEIWSRRVS